MEFLRVARELLQVQPDFIAAAIIVIASIKVLLDEADIDFTVIFGLHSQDQDE
jgi:hypothetical protein